MPHLESAADSKYYHQLPTVSYRVIEDDPSRFRPAGVHSEQFRHFGYNDFSEFERPDHYIRYIEPIESELAKQVEYDMDEQDQEWMDGVNAERKKEQSGSIPYEVFEIIMDKLEKEWFSLRIPQPASHLPVEDSKCSICDDGEGDNSNAIVFCDGCNLAVHQDCYGVPYIPEGQWLCRKCSVSPENPVSCLFCPNEGGAFKQTTTGHWAHLVCALWIPEVGMGNAVYMEPVEGVEAIPKNRWKLMGLLTSMKVLHQNEPLRAYCEKHLPDDLRKEDVLAFSDAGSDYDDDEFASPNRVQGRRGNKAAAARRQSLTHPTEVAPVTTKMARAHAKSYRPGPPIVPRIILQSVLDYVAKITIRKRVPFVERVCRYWSLKREARRGAPLLKRLHLEPWTASREAKQQTDAEKQLQLQFIAMLRNDLEKVRMLAEQVRKREKKKLAQAQVIKEVVDEFLFKGDARLRLTLEKISAMDRQEYFLHPVDAAIVPDYYTVIKEPMYWMAIDDKLDKNRYTSVAGFVHDIHLTLDNAMLYNAADTPFHRAAKRIKANAAPLLAELEPLAADALLVPQISVGDDERSDEAYDVAKQNGVVGDLEASLVQLHALMQPDSADGSRDNLASLFMFELEPIKEPTPPPPPPPPKRKHMSAAERKLRWEERNAAHKERMSLGRSTRGARAVEEAFENEARGGASAEGDDGAVEEAVQPLVGRSRSTRRKAALDDEATGEGSSRSARGPAEDEGTAATHVYRRQKGVSAIETVAVISEKERRRQERELDLAIDSVDPKTEFKMFNIGWVLPEGSKRRRAEPALPSASAGANTADARRTETKRGRESKTGRAARGGMATPTTPAPAATPAPAGNGKRSAVPESSPLSSASSDTLTPPSSRDGRDDSEAVPVSAGAEVTDAAAASTVEGAAEDLEPDHDHDHDHDMDESAESPTKLGNRGQKRKGRQGGRWSRHRKRARKSGAGDKVEEGSGPSSAGTFVVTTRSVSRDETDVAGNGNEDVDDKEEGEELSPLTLSAHASTPGAGESKRAAADELGAGATMNGGRRGRAKGKGKGSASVARGRKGGVELGPRGDMAVAGEDDITPLPSESAEGSATEEEEEIEDGDGEVGDGRGGSPTHRSPPRSARRTGRRGTAKGKEVYVMDDSDAEDAVLDPEPVVDEAEGELGASEEQKDGGEVANEDQVQDSGEAEEENPYPEGTLVWAKYLSFPYFAAEVLDPDDPDLALSNEVWGMRPPNSERGAGRCWLVRFYDSRSSYAWVPAKKLDMLGEDNKIDEMYLQCKERGRGGGAKSTTMKKQVQKGYRQAMAALASASAADEDEDEDEAEGEAAAEAGADA